MHDLIIFQVLFQLKKIIPLKTLFICYEHYFKVPGCKKSRDSLDNVHGLCPAGVLEQRTMDNVQGVHGHCPGTMLSRDNVQ